MVRDPQSRGIRRHSTSRESFHLQTLRRQRTTFMARVWLGAGIVTGFAIVALTASMIVGSPDGAQSAEQSAEAPGSDTDSEESDAATGYLWQDTMNFARRLA